MAYLPHLPTSPLPGNMLRRLQRGALAKLLKAHPATANRLRHYEAEVATLLATVPAGANVAERLNKHQARYLDTHRATMVAEQRTGNCYKYADVR